MELQSELNDERLTETICRLMEENYDLGKLIRVKEIIGGYCNKSYAVWILADDHTHRYFLRLYNRRPMLPSLIQVQGMEELPIHWIIIPET